MNVPIPRCLFLVLIGACLGWTSPAADAEEKPEVAAPWFTFTFPGQPKGSGEVQVQPDAVPEGITVSDFLRTGVREARGKDVFNSRGWKAGAAPDPGSWVGCTMTVRPGHVLRLTRLRFWAKGSRTVPDQFRIELEIRRSDGSTEHTASPVYPVSVNGDMETWIFPNALELRDGDSVTIRWQVFGTTAADGFTAPKSVGTFQLDAVSFFGEVEEE